MITRSISVYLSALILIAIVASVLAGCGMAAVTLYGADIEAKAASRRQEGESLARDIERGDIGAAVHCVSYCAYLFSTKSGEKALQERVDQLIDRAATIVIKAYENSSAPEHWNPLVYAYRRQIDVARDAVFRRQVAEKILEVTGRPSFYQVSDARYATSSAIAAFEVLMAMQATGIAGFRGNSAIIRNCDLSPIALQLAHVPEKSWAEREAICGSAYYKTFRERMPEGYLLPGPNFLWGQTRYQLM